MFKLDLIWAIDGHEPVSLEFTKEFPLCFDLTLSILHGISVRPKNKASGHKFLGAIWTTSYGGLIEVLNKSPTPI